MRSERRTQQRPAWSTQPGSCGAAFTEPGTQRGHKYCGSAALALWLCASVAVCFCGRMRVCVPLRPAYYSALIITRPQPLALQTNLSPLVWLWCAHPGPQIGFLLEAFPLLELYTVCRVERSVGAAHSAVG